MWSLLKEHFSNSLPRGNIVEAVKIDDITKVSVRRERGGQGRKINCGGAMEAAGDGSSKRGRGARAGALRWKPGKDGEGVRGLEAILPA